jgi:hypothetical protein
MNLSDSVKKFYSIIETNEVKRIDLLLDALKTQEELNEDKNEQTASSIAWEKIQAKELERKGYNSKEIAILNSIDRHLLDKDALEYFLKEYIHNFITYKREYEKLNKKYK